MVSISLSYEGGLSDNNVIDLYDAARGLAGFQRSLALTIHLAINGEIITQAPSLKGANILVTTPEAGSWKVNAKILLSTATLATIGGALIAPKDTVGGHLMFSLYDYVVNSALGFDIDYDKSLRVQYEEHLDKKKITAEKLDSLIEKTESSIADIHRPIVGSKTANFANLQAFPEYSRPFQIGPLLSGETYEYLSHGYMDKLESNIVGKVASFNLSTYKGRIFIFEEQRPIPFELHQHSRINSNVVAITTSLRLNSINRDGWDGSVELVGRKSYSANGRLKSIIVTSVRVPSS